MIDTSFFPGAKFYWYQGKICDWNEFGIHSMTHALHYGTSVFEGIRAYDTDNGPAVFRLDEHMRRFFHSATTINAEMHYTAEQIKSAIKLVVRKNAMRSAYIRPLLFFSYGNLGLVPKASRPELIIGCWGWGAYLGEEAFEKGIHGLIVPWKRLHPSQVDVRSKLGGLYVQSMIAGNHARKLGFGEGIFLNLEGRVAEGPGENIIIVKNGVLKANTAEESILEGITRQSVLDIARNLGYEVAIGPITLEDLYSADEAFFCGTAAEVTPLTRVTDGRDSGKSQSEWPEYQIGSGMPGEITRNLAKVYGEIVRGKHPEYERWLTYVYDSPEAAQQVLGDVTEERLTNF